MIDCNFYAKGPVRGSSKMIYCETEERAMRANSAGFDIFWCPNVKNETGERKKDNVSELRWVFADFDNIDLPTLKSKINGLLDPSMVIKTRSGFHIYWELIPIEYDSKLDASFKEFCDTRLIPLGADNQVKDVTRLLRPPMMRYWYDSKDRKYDDVEIHTELVYASSKKYSWDDMQECPKLKVNPRPKPSVIKRDGDLWAQAKLIPIKDALATLSGEGCVGYERYSFKGDASGTRIMINEKPSNAWIDKSGMIGSTVGAGPTIVEWLKYYGHDLKTIAKILKEDLL